jgi:hypothetical protein
MMLIITFGSVLVAVYYSHKATHFKEIDELRKQLEEIDNMKQDIATIKTDIQWIKQILQDGHK